MQWKAFAQVHYIANNESLDLREQKEILLLVILIIRLLENMPTGNADLKKTWTTNSKDHIIKTY